MGRDWQMKQDGKIDSQARQSFQKGAGSRGKKQQMILL